MKVAFASLLLVVACQAGKLQTGYDNFEDSNHTTTRSCDPECQIYPCMDLTLQGKHPKFNCYTCPDVWLCSFYADSFPCSQVCENSCDWLVAGGLDHVKECEWCQPEYHCSPGDESYKNADISQANPASLRRNWEPSSIAVDALAAEAASLGIPDTNKVEVPVVAAALDDTPWTPEYQEIPIVQPWQPDYEEDTLSDARWASGSEEIIHEQQERMNEESVLAREESVKSHESIKKAHIKKAYDFDDAQWQLLKTRFGLE